MPQSISQPDKICNQKKINSKFDYNMMKLGIAFKTFYFNKFCVTAKNQAFSMIFLR